MVKALEQDGYIRGYHAEPVVLSNDSAELSSCPRNSSLRIALVAIWLLAIISAGGSFLFASW